MSLKLTDPSTTVGFISTQSARSSMTMGSFCPRTGLPHISQPPVSGIDESVDEELSSHGPKIVAP